MVGTDTRCRQPTTQDLVLPEAVRAFHVPELFLRGDGVVEVLEQVARDEMSQRQASKELNTSRRTIKRSIDERADLYGL